MKNIIEELLHIHLNKDDFLVGLINKEDYNRECELYNLLYENLSEENKKLLFEYLGLCRVRQCAEIKESYQAGFKTAIKMIIEALNED